MYKRIKQQQHTKPYGLCCMCDRILKTAVWNAIKIDYFCFGNIINNKICPMGDDDGAADDIV